MKHLHRIALALTLFAGLFSACEEPGGNGKDEPVHMSFRATIGEEIGTKTVLQSVSIVNWCAQDEIHVFYGNSEGRFVSTNTSETGTATFEGELPNYQPNENDYYWAVYPYYPEQTCDGNTVTAKLFPSQYAVEDSFEDDVYLSVARSKDKNLQFFNVCGGFRLSVPIEGIRSINLRGKNNEPLAGIIRIGFENDLPVVREILNPESVVTLIAPGDETLIPGAWYYLVTLPTVLPDGYIIECYGYGEDGREKLIYTQEINTCIDISRSAWDEHSEGMESYSEFTGLRINPVEDGAVTISNPIRLTIEYSFDAKNWISSNDNPIQIPVSVSDTLCLRGNNPSYSRGTEYTNIQFSTDCYVFGNLMSLISIKWYKVLNALSENSVFYKLFEGNSHLLNHPTEDIYLPATTLTNTCYSDMFKQCTGLTRAPELPAETLAPFCYYKMFSNCTSLITGPTILPATTLAPSCYYSMFDHCTSLTTAPEIPATTLARYCCDGMFSYCTSLTVAPELPATTLASGCYSGMFYYCTSLTTGPTILPATTLAESCYSRMFSYCTNLTVAPELPATTLAASCYYTMFHFCTSLTTGPTILPATTLAESCYSGMFYYCPQLTTAPELPATTLAESCYSCMFFHCYKLIKAPELPATTLAESCYFGMFSNTPITTAPELPATKLAPHCYKDMFHSCPLTNAPELPATTLVEGCYEGMFTFCGYLNNIKALFTTTPGPEYTAGWVDGVAADGTFVKNPDATWDVTGPDGIPEGWTVVYD